MLTGSSGTLISWKSGKTTDVPLWDQMEGAWLWTQEALCVTGVMTRHAMGYFHHGGVLCTFSNREQPQNRGKRSCGLSGQAAWTVHHVQKHTLQPARRAAVLGQPSSLRPHCIDTLISEIQRRPVLYASMFTVNRASEIK
jgi:hypothetical protein